MPGAVQDRLFCGLLRQLSLQTMVTVEPPEQVASDAAHKREASRLMQRASCLRGSSGLTFAGITMSLQKAASIFTVTSYVVIREIRYDRIDCG